MRGWLVGLLSTRALIVAAASLSVGCKASASVHGTNATKLNTTTQVAYVTAPVKK